jgi:pimeloyl-ACP methyl ester carboxylesterase
MQAEELRALGDFAGGAAAGLASQVREVHQGIAERVFGTLGPLGQPVRAVHDRVADGAYAGACSLTAAVVRGGAFAISLTRPDDAPSITGSRPGRLAIGALNGAWGDLLHSRSSPLETPMAVRRRGRDVPLDATSLAEAFPDATGRLVVFVHGLCETDDSWHLGAGRHVPYGERMRTEIGYTPVYVRYNSGLHISHNGRRMSEALEELTANWPMQVTEIALVGHSMGGLVSRSSCYYAGEGSWREQVRHIFMLGAPHKGAPLELGANAACAAISALPETRGFAKPLKVRSAGVKDLGYGYVVDEDWSGHDPDAYRNNTGTVVPFLTSATHYFVSATLSREADHPVGRMMGDLLVLRPSAWSQDGSGERLQFPVDQYRHFGSISHFQLLNHPAVYAQMTRWLGTRRQLLAAPAPPDDSA